MESVTMKNQSVSSYNNKQNKTPKKRNNARSFISQSSENQAPMSFHGSLSHFPHRSLSFPYPHQSSSSPFLLSQPYQYQQNPPLLPLPSAPISRNHSISLSPQQTSKQSLQRSRINHRSKPKQTKSEDESPIVAASRNDRKAPQILSSMGSVVVVADQLEKFGGESALTLISPPPSSLPLPRFSMRPTAAKLSCNAEAAGIDAGATDNLRRILRLR